MFMQRQPITISREALFILKTLQEHSYDAYLVGGAVRDILLTADNSPIDYDFTTNATPEQIMELFPEAFYENTFGTVMITPEDAREQFGLPSLEAELLHPTTDSDRIVDLAAASKVHESLAIPEETELAHTSKIDDHNYEITTYRSEDAYSDHRRPDSVTWGETLAEDLERRDFTVNALAITVASEFLEVLDAKSDSLNITVPAESYRIIDHHNGLADLSAGTLRTVGNPNARFVEDALRILRAIRFAVQLNMEIEPATFAALSKHAPLLAHVSWERISTEFLKMLASPAPKTAVELLDQTGALELVLPELLDAKGIEQAGHHTTDVWTHSLEALETCPSANPIVRLATLIHDIGKPATQHISNGQITFYNHEVVGSRMAKQIARRLKLSKKNQDRLFILVRHHMFHYQPKNTDASIRRFMRKVGLENIDDILDLREGDRLGSGARRTSWRLEEMKQRMIEQLNQPLEIKDLAIDGHYLMKTFQLKPGPILGSILNHLFEQVLKNPDLNTPDALTEIATKYLQQAKES